MTQKSISTRPAVSAAEGTARDHAISPAETSVRQLIVHGNYKTALKRAKEIHKAHSTAASEALLLETYAARIESLMRQNLAVEADGLLNLVRQRYPSAGARLDALSTRALIRAGSLNEALAPLNDPTLGAERRAAIERAIQH